MNSELPYLIEDIYLAQKKLSQGSFGTVYQGTNLDTKANIAIKIEKEFPDSAKSYTAKEVAILKKLQEVKGIPKLYWFNEKIIVLSLLGKDLSSYLKIFKKFSHKTITMLTLQIINILENIHNLGIIHRDLKPENILVGRGEDCKQIFVIDYGISKITENLNELVFKQNKSFVGTARYASVAAHKGYELSRKDDLESLFYVMVFCAKGFLPWQKIKASDEEKILRVGKIKEDLTVNEVCQGMPLEFIEAFTYIKKLKFEDKVDYDYLKKLMIKFSEEEEFDIDNIFDWISPFQFDKKTFKKKYETVIDVKPKEDKNIKIHKTNTNAVEEKQETTANGQNNFHFSSQNSLTTVPVNNVSTVEKEKKFQQYNTSRFQKANNELLTIPGTDSFQISENSSINLSSKCSSMIIMYEDSEKSYGFSFNNLILYKFLYNLAKDLQEYYGNKTMVKMMQNLEMNKMKMYKNL